MSQTQTLEELPDIDGDFPPRLTRALVGHERQMSDFVAAAQGGRLQHAWLLTGPKGVGKASFAYLVARAVLMARQPEDISRLSPAENTSATRLIETGVYPDLHILRRCFNEKTDKFRTEISVDDARDLKRRFALSSAHGGWRVAIVDAIDEVSKSGVNALLKLIEEPPDKCLFLIICHHPGRQPDTIKSRCRALSFNALEEDELQQIIAHRLSEIGANEAAGAAFLADGSAGRALSLAQHGGFDLYRDMISVLEGAPQLDVERLHALAGRFGARAEPHSFALFCYLLSGWLYRMVRHAASGQAFQPVFEGEAELVDRLMAAHLPLEPILGLWEKMQQETRQIEALNLDKKQAVLNWLGEFADMSRPAAR